jgi:Tol biopolymer transport system component
MTPGGDQRQLLPFGCNTAFGPSWSPNGRRLAYASYPPAGNTDIYVGPRSGDAMREVQMTDLGPYDEEPTWAPNGDKIAFSDQDNGLWTVDVGTPLAETAIPNTADVNGAQPAWQPK